MKHILKCIFGFSILLITSFVGHAQNALSNKGNDFWIAFPVTDNENSNLYLYINSELVATGKVSIPGLNYEVSFNSVPGKTTTITLPAQAQVLQIEGVIQKGIHITSDNEISLFGLNYLVEASDGFLAIPTQSLGTSYIVASYEFSARPTQFSIVATDDATSVTITLTTNSFSHGKNIPFTIDLNQGEVFVVLATGEFTGSLVTSNKPIAVFGSNPGARIPNTCDANNYIVEQLPPVSSFGKLFYTTPFAIRSSGDIIRVVASEDNTNIVFNGTVVSTLNKGQFFDQLVELSSEIISDKPILVVQYARGGSCDNKIGDPTMMIIPPYEQYLSNYSINTPSEQFNNSNYINIVIPSESKNDVSFDNSILDQTIFTKIQNTNLYFTQLHVSSGSHTIKSSNPLGVYVYGFSGDDAYGFPAGQSYAPIASVNTLFLTQTQTQYFTSENACVKANVGGLFGVVEGVRVDFTVSGTNILIGSAYTDDFGWATFCYKSSTVGNDEVIANVGTIKSNILEEIWTNPPQHIICGTIVSKSTECQESGYYPTDFFEHTLQILKELLNMKRFDIVTKIGAGTNSTFCPITSLSNYTSNYPFKQIAWGAGGIALIAQNENDICIRLEDLFKNSSDPIDFKILLSQLLPNHTEYNLKWTINKNNGNVTIWIEDQNGAIKTWDGKEKFVLETLNYSFCSTTTEHSNSYSNAATIGMEEGVCYTDADGNNSIDKSCFTLTKYVECLYTPLPQTTCGKIISKNNNCQESGYYPTDFLEQTLNILKELSNTNPNDLDFDHTGHFCWDTLTFSITKLKAYTSNYPFKKMYWGYGSIRFTPYSFNDGILFSDFFRFSNATAIYFQNFLWNSLVAQKHYLLNWDIDKATGLVNVWLEDVNGNKISYNGRQVFPLDALNYTYCNNISENPNSYSNYVNTGIEEGVCITDANGNDAIDKMCFTTIKYVECVEPTLSPKECIPSFMPEPGSKYVLSAWVNENDWQNKSTFNDAIISLQFRDADSIYNFKATGKIIDGWQKIEKEFIVPPTATDIKIILKNIGSETNQPNVYFDDIRVYPFNANMKSFVYDPISGKLIAELDENNYASYYEYDEEGALVRVKKETERGVKTIQESRNNSVKQGIK